MTGNHRGARVDVERFQDEHRAIEALRADLAAAITARDSAAVGAVRWRLYRILLTHLACEDQAIYRPMIVLDGAGGRLARRLQAEIGDLGAAFRDHIAAWPIIRVTADWPGYEAEARRLEKMLLRRISSEEAQLFPLVAEAGARRAA